MAVTMDYKSLTIDEMVDYILEYDNNEEALKFMEGFYESRKKYKLVAQYNEDGTVKKKRNKKGVEIIEKKKVEVEGEEERFNLRKAVSEFYDRYKDEIEFINAPKKEIKNNKIKNAMDRLREGVKKD